MNEEVDDYSSNAPDFSQILVQRLTKQSELKPVNGFDPYKVMLNKKNGEEAPLNVSKWPEKDLKALQDFCKENGVVGFNTGRMPPVVALAMLKDQMGLKNVPLVPTGYQKMGSNATYNPHYPYESAINNNKTVLHG